MRSEQASEEQVRLALAAWDAAFASGSAEALAEAHAADAQLLLLYGEPLISRAAIGRHWAAFFERFDTSAWQADYDFVASSEGLAVAIGTYSETLLEKDIGERTLIRGRVVHVLQRDADGVWRIIRTLNSHSHRPELVDGDYS